MTTKYATRGQAIQVEIIDRITGIDITTLDIDYLAENITCAPDRNGGFFYYLPNPQWLLDDLAEMVGR
ncbi:MAG: hypothetical protein FWF25_02755 [Propionibacteriaceae bacterium]|nr:hypothetical protein [Propionibacteriaceae bacterium]